MVPYVLNGDANFTDSAKTLQAVAYTAEAMVALGVRPSMPGASTGTTIRAEMRRKISKAVAWLLRTQQPDGSWQGTSSAHRVSRAVSLLQYAWLEWGQDEAVAAAIRRFVLYLVRSPANSRSWGVKQYVCQTGFVGLAFVDLISDWATFPAAGRQP